MNTSFADNMHATDGRVCISIPAELRDRIKSSAKSSGQTIQGFAVLALEAELRRRSTLDPEVAIVVQQAISSGH